MKTIDEMVAVMQAYKDGKEIESRPHIPCSEWHHAGKPGWDWSCIDYRVKPEPKYVPYDSVMEVERDKWVRIKADTSIIRRISTINLDKNEVFIGGFSWTLKELFENYEYEDGSPCGKKVEE